MRVSIVVPTRNRPLQLAVAIDAIAVQTHQDVEIIVVDDGSNADSAMQNERLAKATRGAVYLRLANDTPHGGGPSRARNAGIAIAKGELIGFCDDDDYWCDQHHLASTVAAFGRNQSLDLLFGNQAVHREAKLTREHWLPKLEAILQRNQKWRELPTGEMMLLARGQILVEHFPHMNTCIFRRTLLDRIDGFWEQVRYHEDLDFFVRALDAARETGCRKQTVSVHNVPNRSLNVNASTQLDAAEKELTNTLVAAHLIGTCVTRECREYAKRFGNWSWRNLAAQAVREKQWKRAAIYARHAFAIRPTVKGVVHSAGLSAMSIFL